MALSLASKASGNGINGDVTITKPSSLAEGDLMIAFIASASANNDKAHTGPSGWTKLQEIVPNNGTILTVWGVVATSDQTAATNFSWASGATDNNTTGIIYRITGALAFGSLAINVDSASGHSYDYPTASFGGLTTEYDNALLLMCAAERTADGNVTFSNYAVANSNPTWTQQDDLYYRPSGLAINMAVASATYPTAGATGNFSITMSQDGGDISGALVAIYESQDSTFNADPLVINATLPDPTYTADANFTADPLVVTSTMPAETHSQTDPTWSNTDKSSAPSWSNKEKS